MTSISADLIWRARSLTWPPCFWCSECNGDQSLPFPPKCQKGHFISAHEEIAPIFPVCFNIFPPFESWTGDKLWRVSVWQSGHVPENVMPRCRGCGFHLSRSRKTQRYSMFLWFKSVAPSPTGCEALLLHSVIPINLRRPQIQLQFVEKWCRVEVDIKASINSLAFHLSGNALDGLIPASGRFLLFVFVLVEAEQDGLGWAGYEATLRGAAWSRAHCWQRSELQMASWIKHASVQRGPEKIVHLYIAGPVLQVDRSPPACSQISACSPKSTREEAEERLPLFAPSLLMPRQIWCQSSGSEMNLHLLRMFSWARGSTFVYIHTKKIK